MNNIWFSRSALSALMLATGLWMLCGCDPKLSGTTAADPDQCKEEAEGGAIKVDCPAGMAPNFEFEAESMCEGDLGVDVPNQNGTVAGQCTGVGGCAYWCEVALDCGSCGAERITNGALKCRTNCGIEAGTEAADVLGQTCSSETLSTIECPVGTSPRLDVHIESICEGNSNSSVANDQGIIEGYCASEGDCSVWCPAFFDCGPCGIDRISSKQVICKDDC